MSMKLYASGPSPFVRKVAVCAHELGLATQLQMVMVATTPVAPAPELLAKNPLRKIPALELADGTMLYDSHVICSYLDELAGGNRLVPAKGPERFQVLRLEALCNGILEAGIAVRYETVLRPKERQWVEWVDAQSEKVAAGVAALAAEVASFGDRVDLGTISAACTLAWLDFREPVPGVRKGKAELGAWFERFSARPSMKATLPIA